MKASTIDADGRLAASLQELGVPALYEAGSRAGLMRGVRLLVGARFAGRAATVAIATGDNLGIHLALQSALPGTVLCVASQGGGVYGVVGELIVKAARARSVAAIVVDDGIRDVEQLEAPPALAALGVSSRGTSKRRVRSLGEPVPLGGVLVRPGDWIVGDRNGVCVLPPERAVEIAHRAKALGEKEATLKPRLEAGVTTVDALGLSPPTRRR